VAHAFGERCDIAAILMEMKMVTMTTSWQWEAAVIVVAAWSTIVPMMRMLFVM